MKNESILSKKFKTKEWKAKKKTRHEENVALRAALHKQKSSYRNDAGKVLEAQQAIDQISKRT